MLTSDQLERILERLPGLRIGVLGDLFLDRYLDLAPLLTEPSLETGLDAYQVARVRACPGAAGTVINNLASLGVGQIVPIAMIGDDGEGYELRQALTRLRVVDLSNLVLEPTRRTPTYTKPMMGQLGGTSRELNRFDIKNRDPLPEAVQQAIMRSVERLLPSLDALLVLDQVSEAECGVVTASVRELLARLSKDNPERIVLADSRERIGAFRGILLKPNLRECQAALGAASSTATTAGQAATDLARRVGRCVFCTCGEQGIWVAFPDDRPPRLVPGYPVEGPIDSVGAGDSTSAGIACALAAGFSEEIAASFGNLIASITIQQLGTTGTASPRQAREQLARCLS